ncbi:MAG: class I SAM-dependent methyltransferase [Candidatus Nanoarchaeia archaeon]|nr:class I SAM-dependent methyltransferase [Candidatus Nanoarchaeia archaeon]MDD5239261.1 class I SAM-dependent methyltransferase [Candidatus Nanoarchaeia archaeon]
MDNDKPKILNIGCGNQTYGNYFIDLYPKREEVKKCDIESEKLPFKDGFFDEVYSSCVFEHLRNPENVLREMKRVLKKNGRIVIVTDNACFLGWSLLKNNSHLNSGCRRGPRDLHYALYTTHHLHNHLEHLNFRNIEVEYCKLVDKNPVIPLNFVLVNILNFFLPKRIACPYIRGTAIK